MSENGASGIAQSGTMRVMEMNPTICYRALLARDPRFDGVFFVGVRTTGIYCRPICPARTPRPDHVRFFATPAAAEAVGLRPCLRCRPEMAPGLAPLENGSTAARRAVARIDAGALRGGQSLENLAQELHLSSRQLRRVVHQEFGATPIQLVQTNRLLLAKQLLTDTALPMIAVAQAAGFKSVRRFNDLFRKQYSLAPSQIRRRGTAVPSDGIRLALAYRPPFAWQPLLRYLGRRAIAGVEVVEHDAYCRTVRLSDHSGWLCVRSKPERHVLELELSLSLAAVLPQLVSRVKHLFDVSARPDVIANCLENAKYLSKSIKHHPGLRVPGSVDGFELAVRAILGQQISVRGASMLAGRLANAFGAEAVTPIPGLHREWPSAERFATLRPATLAKLGLRSMSVRAILGLAKAVADGRIALESGVDPAATIAELEALPGIGPWTAQYIAMRALHWPDAFPDGDLGLRKATTASSARQLRQLSEDWRPWRAYAAMHLWESLR